MWEFPDLRDSAAGAYGDLIATGADLEPETLLAAYTRGLFPMPGDDPSVPIHWWSPARRGVLPLDGLRVSRSLRQAVRRYEIRIDTEFNAVVDGCADPNRPDGWIDDAMRAAYSRMHFLGLAHSVETWHDGELVGGLFGIEIGGLFAGEAMFHKARDASKVALVALVDQLADGQTDRLLDVQWSTQHLASLGVVEIPRAAYLSRLRKALRLSPRFGSPA